MTLRKNKTDNKILFVDASEEFVRLGTKNKLTDKNIDKIINSVKYKTDVEYFSRYVKVSDIVKTNYNLSVNTYIELKHETTDIDINDLNNRIKDIVSKVNELRVSIDEIITELDGDNQ
jgi:type I restriction enzyme M protein